MQIAEDTKFAQVRTHVNYRLKAEADDQALSWIRYSTTNIMRIFSELLKIM